jgi:hypothetical protein
MAATSYQSIKSMSAAFKTALANMEYPYPFDIDDSSMVVLADLQSDLGDILAANPAKLALIIGMEENRLTVCILGADENGEVLPQHVNGNLDGQQTWPDEDTITYAENTEYDNFFVEAT